MSDNTEQIEYSIALIGLHKLLTKLEDRITFISEGHEINSPDISLRQVP